jgi:hypothetical protein
MKSRRCLSVSTLVVLVVSLAACGGAPAGAFPSRGEIDEIAAAPVPSGGLDDRSLDVPSWTLRGAPAEVIEVATANDPTPWGAMLGEVAAARPGLVVVTQAMACVAREAAAFVAEKNAMPAPPLRRFLAARCGAVGSEVTLAYQAGQVPPAMQEADVSRQWGGQVRAMVQGGMVGNRFAGIGFARVGDRAAIVLASAPRRVHLERTPVVAAGGGWVLRGEVLAPAAHLEALVTQGRLGYAECTSDPAVALPRFAFACPASADDASAWIEIAAFPAGRVLGESVVEVQVVTAGKPEATYVHAQAAPRGGPRDPASLAVALVDRLNAVRREGGLGAVRLSPAETRKAVVLAPHYFAALGGHGDVTVADKIALGLQAGWDVEGVVRDGHFTSGRGDAQNPDDLLDLACAGPFGRRALLDPQVQAVAVGTVVSGDALGAVLGTYSLLDTRRSQDEANAVMARLTLLRQGRHLAAPTAVPQLASLLAKAAEQARAGQDPSDTMHWLLQSAADQARGMRVHVWVAQALAVDRLDFPAELLGERALAVAVGVAHHKPAGEPWARLVVFFVTVDEPAANNTAAIGAGRHG